MGTNITGIGNANAIGFKSRVTGGIYFPPELKDALVGVWSAYGKSNDSTDRNIIKNKIKDRGGDFVISNASFKLNSGFGKYEQDFTDWKKSFKVTSFDSESIKFTSDVSWVLLYHPSSIGEDIPSFKVRIKLYGEGTLYYNYINQEGTYTNVAVKSEIFETPICYNTKYIGEKGVNVGFTLGVHSGECSGTITQIPSFEGAFVTDGIDDLIKSTKSATEMLDGSNEVTVVSMIHQIKTNDDTTRNNWFFTPVSYLENRVVENKTGKTGIYGYTSTNVTNAQISDITPILGDKNDYTLYSKIEDGDRDYFTVEGFQNQGIWYVSSIAWYWTIIANKVLTTDQINQVIAYFNLDRCVEPTVLYDVKRQGLSNYTPDSDWYLKDFSKNGFDMSLFNFAKKGGSGVAAKQGESIKDYSIIKDEEYQELTIYNEFKFKIKSKLSGRYWTVQYINITNTSYPVTIVIDKDAYWVNSTTYYDADNNKQVIRKNIPIAADTPTNVLCCGYDQFDIPEDAMSIVSAVSYIDYNAAGEITVEFIPSCKGGLITDGVNDYGKVTGLPIYKDYTVVTDREIFANIGAISSKNNPRAFVETAGNTVYSFGQATSGLNFISTRSISYLSKYSYCGQSITAGAAEDGTDMWLGTIRDNDTRFFNGAIYSLMSFPYSMSEFLIERQLKKHKLGTLYPDMVEFRPVINSNVLLDSKPTFVIRGTSTYLNAGDYVPENSQIWVSIKMNNIADRITKFTVNGKTIDIPENAYSEVTLQYGFPFVIDKSPQKITMTIEQDENYVQLNPIINGGSIFKYLNVTTNKEIFVGDYIHKGDTIRFYVSNISGTANEVSSFTVNGVEGIPKGTNGDLFDAVVTKSPQKINITIDEYIRYEDIVQPYPVLLRFNDENGNEVSWGGKFRVGSTITRIGSIADPESNLLNGLYSISGLSLNGKAVTSSTSIVEKQMVFRTTATWLLDNNEPKVILSPSRLRIPNSSYKLLGYIPDISGHGNHGKINNSAYAEGSGVNEDGSYQFDGVDDFVTIPTLSSGGKQVLMKVNWNTINSIIYDQRGSGGFAIYCSDYNTEGDSITVPVYKGRNAAGTTYIDGIRNEYIIASQLRNVTHNIVEILDTSYAAGKTNPIIGKSHMNSNYGNLALYDFMLFDNISTDDKIKQLNEYVGIEAKVELPPYYWDAYGKTNLDADKATIQQRGVAVGDYDLTNNNFAYDNMSGFGGYTLGKFTNSWSLSNNSNSISIVSRNPYDITLKKLGENSDWEFNTTELKIISNPVSVKFKSDKNIRFTCDYHYYAVGGNSQGAPLGITSKDLIANEDTIITISPISQENIDKYNIDINRGYYLIYFQLSLTLAVNEEVTIEMLPLYPNGLVYDGVSDFTNNKNIPILTDFTFIIKREILGLETNDPMLVIKGDKVYNNGIGNAFILEHNNNGVNYVYSYGELNQIKRDDSKIIYLTPESYNGNPIIKGENGDNLGLILSRHWKGIIYKTILYSKTISLLEINFLKNMMEKDEIIDLNNPIFIQE